MPYIYKIFGDRAKIIPIIVGQNDNKMIEDYGKLFSTYFDRDDTIFIISSDFVIGVTISIINLINKANKSEIYITIRQAWNELNLKNDLKGFDKYLSETGNTICG